MAGGGPFILEVWTLPEVGVGGVGGELLWPDEDELPGQLPHVC